MSLARTALIAAALIACWFPVGVRAGPGSVKCLSAADPAACFIDAANARLPRVTNADERADAVGEFLYALAVTQTRDDSLLDEAHALTGNVALRPAKAMDLLYSVDIYASSIDSTFEQTYLAALARFARLEAELPAPAQIELHMNACAIVGWDEPFKERWLSFARTACTPERIKALHPEGVAQQALVLAMMPIAMALADSREGFVVSADHALTWLAAAEKVAAKSKHAADKDFVAHIGIVMHLMNAFCLETFEQTDASDAEIERARRLLVRMERRTGVSGKSVPLRRQVIESMFDTGREREAKKMLRQLLVHIDADASGKKIPLSEQIAVLLLAAKVANGEEAEQEQNAPESQVAM